MSITRTLVMIQHSFSTFIILITTRLSQHGHSGGLIRKHRSSIIPLKRLNYSRSRTINIPPKEASFPCVRLMVLLKLWSISKGCLSNNNNNNNNNKVLIAHLEFSMYLQLHTCRQINTQYHRNLQFTSI